MKKQGISGINFDLPERYEPIKLIGKGTYGAVISAIDNINNEKVAIKKLSKIEDMVHTLISILTLLDWCQASAQRDKNHEKPAAWQHTWLEGCSLCTERRVC